jgi:DNA-3-methyladenine glycosylase II
LKAIETERDIARAAKALLAADPRLAPIAEIAGPLPLRRRDGGFEGLAAIVTSQQISDMAGAAIWRRLKTTVEPFSPETFLATPEEALKAAGLSRPKIRTLTGVAAAMADGFDLDAIHALAAEEAMAKMVTLKGIGPWTAEIYLLFCVGHPDIFPAGDLALQAAVHHGLRMRKRPDEKKLRKVAEKWSPWRGVAARLFWAYYRARRAAAKELASAARQGGRSGA